MTDKAKTLKVAAVQMLSFEGEGERNVERMVARINEAAQALPSRPGLKPWTDDFHNIVQVLR